MIQADYFAARWYGKVQAPTADTYTFTARTDDGVRVWVDKQLVVDFWSATGPTDRSGTIALTAASHDILMEDFEKAGGATAQLSWSNASGTISESLVPIQQLTPASAAYHVPTIALTPPVGGSGPITLTATVMTNDAVISAVTFATNGVLLATDSIPPYTYSWSGAAPGTYAISAQVLYNASTSGADPSSMALSGTNSVTVIANPAAAVTITNISTTTIGYTGGAGSQFVLLTSSTVNAAMNLWTPVATNTVTGGTFTTPGPGYYRIESK